MNTLVKYETFLDLSLNVMDQISRSGAKYTYTITCRILAKNLGWDYAELWTKDFKSFDLIPSSFYYATDESTETFAKKIKKDKLTLGESFPGLSWKHKKALWFQHIDQDTSWLRMEGAKQAGLKTCMAIPMMIADSVDAVILLFSKRVLEEDKKLLEYMNILSYYIGLNTLKKELDAFNNPHFCSEDQSVEIISRIFNTRDPYTAVHENTVRCFALKLADLMHFNQKEKHDLSIAASLHDIGKIAIPMEILSKPSKLSKEEYSLIKTHVQIGYDLIEDLSYSEYVKRMVLEHHERIDGSGYPHGKKREDIYIGSQLLAVADVVSAMLENRPYRVAHQKKTVIDELLKFSDTKYNKEIVNFAIDLIRNDIKDCFEEPSEKD